MELESKDAHQSPKTSGLILKEDRDKIIRTFLTRLKEDLPDAQKSTQAQLQNSMPKLLLRLSDLLMLDSPNQRTIANSSDISKEHADHRLLQDFNLTEVLYEYQILRQVILDDLEEKIEVPRDKRNLILDYIQQSMRKAAIEFVSQNVTVTSNIEEHISKSKLRVFGITVLTVAIATGLQVIIWPWIQPAPYLLSYPAVIIAALIGDGILATFLAAVVVEYFFNPPLYSIIPSWPSGWIRLSVFVLSGISISYFAKMIRKSRKAAQIEKAKSMTFATERDALARIASIAASPQSLDEIFDDITAKICTNLKADHGRIFQISTENNGYFLRTCFGCEHRAEGIRPLDPNELVGYSLLNNTAIIVNNFHKSDSFASMSAFTNAPAVSAMAIPIRANQRVFGAIVISSTLPEQFDNDTKSFVITAADTLANVIERKEVEEKLRLSETRLRLALDAAEIGTWTYNLKTHVANRDPKLNKILGLPLEFRNHHGDDFLNFVHPEDRAKWQESFNQARALRTSYTSEYRIVRPNGEIRWCRTVGSWSAGSENEGEYLTGVVIDITDAKIAENWLKKSEQQLKDLNTDLEKTNVELAVDKVELFKANTELSRFASIAAHDLKAPLNSITQFLEIFVTDYRGKISAEADEYISFIMKAADRLRALIDRLLNYSRVGVQGVEFKPVDCNKVLKAAEENLKALIDVNHAEIKAGNLPVIKGDDIELMQLFQNLISNSLKFKSTLPPLIEISAEDQQDHWRFTFKDNGIGFETEDAQKVFEPFKKSHSGQNYEGTGLGLAICKRIIEHHSGKIWAQSSPGKGATFFFHLPKA